MKVSIEVLYHFQCEACKAWFTVADAQVLARAGHERISCPFCGQDHIDARDLPRHS